MTCPHGVGSKTKTNIVFEDTYGVIPDDADTKTVNIPFNTNGLASSQNTTNPATIRGKRDPVEPILGNNDVSGDIVVPVDYTAFGYMLMTMFGAPVTTAGSVSGTYVHVFKVPETQPSLTIEKAFPGISQYIQDKGCKASKLSMSIGGDGELVATISFLGAKEDTETASMGGDSVIEPNLNRANNFQAAVKMDGTAVGNVLTMSLDVDNGLDGDTFTIGQQGFRSAICEGLMAISGTLEAFFKDDTYLRKAEESTEVSLEIVLTQGDYSLSILLPEVKFGRTSPPIDGPAGIKQSVPFNAFYNDNANGSAIVVTLTNKQASYEL